MNVYLDNASTTKLSTNVFISMKPYIFDFYGNPSSIHRYGIEAKSILERSRLFVSEILNTDPSEIFFTSGGTEGNNMIIYGFIKKFKIKNVITSPIEHYSIIKPLKNLYNDGLINLNFLNIDEYGNIDYIHLESLLKKNNNSMVLLMHVNNEIGNINNISLISNLCKKYSSIFHSDVVQSIGCFKYNLQLLPVHFLVASAHKFHGPKGIGLVYMNKSTSINSFISGGIQEMGIRAGTENISGVVGFAKSLEIAYNNMKKNKSYIEGLKYRMICKLKKNIPNVIFNGNSGDMKKSIYNLLNVSFPSVNDYNMFLFDLNIKNIFVSSGSACISGATNSSHVLNFLNLKNNIYKKKGIRFSFSKYNTVEEIDYVVNKISEILLRLNHFKN